MVSPPGKPTGVKLIQYGNDTSNMAFGYDMAGNVIKVNYISGGPLLAYDVTYTNGVPAQMVTTNSNTILSFTNGLLQKSDLYNNNGQDLQASTVYNYINNRLSSFIYYQQHPAGLQQVFKYEYDYLASGDIGTEYVFVMDVNTNQFQLLWTFKCDYDNHPNPLYALRNFYIQFYGIPDSPHNLTKITVYDPHNAVRLTADFIYTYNQNSYPAAAERTTIQHGATPETNHLKYTYQ